MKVIKQTFHSLTPTFVSTTKYSISNNTLYKNYEEYKASLLVSSTAVFQLLE